MKFRPCVLIAALALPASVALADPALSDPDSLPKVSCTEFTYSATFLSRYPKAPAACQEGRVVKGVKYAKFNAKVYLANPDFITVQLLNVAGDMISTFSFKPGPGAQIVVNGKPEGFSDLKPGDAITFWLPEKSLKARALPGPTKQAWRVLPPQ
jgi:hypothetical protein